MFGMRKAPSTQPSILLVPIGDVDASSLEPLAPQVAQLFGCEARVHSEREVALTPACDPARAQCDASKLLAALLARFADHRGKVVGVTRVDLCAPGLAWVFGQAQVEGRAALVSTHRLAERFHGREPDEALERKRLVTELCHETGHAFGLGHCAAPACVMNWSATVEQIESKGAVLCDHCADRLAQLRDGTAPRRTSIVAGR